MAKLYFRYGAMHSAKTMNLLAVAHNYRIQNKPVLLLKPSLDTRMGSENIKSRAGLVSIANILIYPEMSLKQVLIDQVSNAPRTDDFSLNGNDRMNELSEYGIYCILVDEAQFLSTQNVNDLRDFCTEYNIPVICYGLRTDFASNLFEGSKRLMELADTIEEVKTTCFYCNRKATMNLRHLNGKAVDCGPSIMLGGEESYHPTCYPHYKYKLDLAKELKEHKN